jgi:hypothetical protein
MPLEIAQAMPSTARRAAIVLGQDLPTWFPINAQLGANAQGVKNVIQIDNGGEFELRSIIATSTGLFGVTLTNNKIKRPLMPSPIDSELIAGNAQQPGFLPVPWRIERTSILEAQFFDRSGAPNTIQLCLQGYTKFNEGKRPNFIPNVLGYRKAISHVYMPSIAELAQLDGKMPYWWPIIDVDAVPAQQAVRNKFTIPDGCYWTHIVAGSSQAAGFVLQIYDTDRQQIFEDSPTTVSGNHVGTAQQPFWLKKVYKLPTSGQMQCRVINLAAAANDIQVVLCGVRD